MPNLATARVPTRAELLDFLRPRHKGVLITARRDGRPQVSPVACGLSTEGHLVVSTYPERAKARNAGRDPRVTLCVLSDDWDGAYVQVDGRAEVIHLPEAVEPLVEYYRCISGEHPDWDEYREAMRRQGKCLIRIAIEDWGPIATGGFPPNRVP
ncbi:PPOX class F420-dependent oxidoreductase [Allokutzneria albata]|uniref:PPOX class probable F420-dependent enzyme n=1 Tax=Allokutzneria albata TaxID=211114 RepID=A0A1G9WNF7_ALLAB|nr:PPOX class F420-dependent oxidoreductase [Allokutzneria albata]SDM85907.1 PPOX class probable F420-dependent enzyme [Allokutzneria albata]